MKFRIPLLVLTMLMYNIMLAQKYSIEPIPDWVQPVAIPDSSTLSKYDVSSGYYATLANYQIRMDNYAVFTNLVTNVVAYSGITNASQLMIDYDTSYQQLQIHHLHIWRKGKKIDRTPSLSFEIMNNEYNLDKGIYTGRISAYDILEDIRKDDMIDFAYTLVGYNPIFGDQRYLFVPLESSNHIDLFALHVMYPKDKDYTIDAAHCDSIALQDTVIGDFRHLNISIANSTGKTFEDYIPSWVIPYKFLSLTSFKSWVDVNTWAQEVFALENEPALDGVFAEVFAGNESLDQKINKLIDYVQDEIRYMGIESGIGSIKPFHPEQVVSQRFGDCKDKSLLLVWLLKQVGIAKAYPVLVNTKMLQELDKENPSSEVFNHCIVRFEHNNSVYWLDPTIAQQGGGYQTLYVPDYGKVLVVGQPADSLTTMAPSFPPSGVVLEQELTVKSFTEPAVLRLTSSRQGAEADNGRAILEYYSTQKLAEMVVSDLKQQYPTVSENKPMQVADDIDSNTLALTYSYLVDGFWQDGDPNTEAKDYRIFRFDPHVLYEYVNKSACKERQYDLQLNYPLNFTLRAIFNFPKELFIGDDYKSVDNEAFFYDEKLEQLSPTSFRIEYRFRHKADRIKAADYKRICGQKNDMAKDIPMVIYFKK